MALQLREHPLELAGPLVDLQFSNPSVMTRETRDEFSNPPVERACMLAIQQSQLLERAPQTSSVISLGFTSFLSSLWTVAPSPLHCSGHPDVSGHNSFAASLLTTADFPLPNSSRI